MPKTPAVLIDDLEVNDQYDLKQTLSGWRDGLAAVVEPTGTEAGEATAADPSAPEDKNDSITTRGLKTARVLYRVSGKRVSEREFTAPEGPDVLRQLGSPVLVVSFVSHSTYPLLVALARHATTRDFLRVGVTGVRMDTAYNLARKLVVDGDIDYHEHTRALEKVLCRRLDLMLAAHNERLRSGTP